MIRDWGPEGIAKLTRAVLRYAYWTLRRKDCPGEAARMIHWFQDDYRRHVAEMILHNLGLPERAPAIYAAHPKAIIRDLAKPIMVMHLQVEVNSQKKRKAKT